MFTVGEATITRIEETNLPTYPIKQVFPAITDAQLTDAVGVIGDALAAL